MVNVVMASHDTVTATVYISVSRLLKRSHGLRSYTEVGLFLLTNITAMILLYQINSNNWFSFIFCGLKQIQSILYDSIISRPISIHRNIVYIQYICNTFSNCIVLHIILVKVKVFKLQGKRNQFRFGGSETKMTCFAGGEK